MKTCILTLDFINDICHPKGKIANFSGRIKENKTIENANHILAWARDNNHLIAHIKVGFHAGYQDSSTISPMFSKAQENHALALGEWGTDFCDELDYQPKDLVIVKHRVSAFYGTDLELILRANNIEHLILTGVATNNAVELTAREAHDRDFKVTVIEDAVETNNDEEQRASLSFLTKISTLCHSNNYQKVT